jgi:hypothetical protein
VRKTQQPFNNAVVPQTKTSLYIGHRPQGSSDNLKGQTFSGFMDEVRIYNFELSATEILKIYNDFTAIRPFKLITSVNTPVFNNCHITFTNNGSSGKVSIYNVAGKYFFETSYTSSQKDVHINTATLQSGYYIFSRVTPGEFLSYRFMVK